MKASLIIVPILTLLSACNRTPTYDKSSRGTGWQVSGLKKGIVSSRNLSGQDTAPGLVFIEGGSFMMGKIEDDVIKDMNNAATQQHVQSFYMDETEVTNGMYLEYVAWIKKVFPPADPNYKNIYNGVVPDTLVWRNPLGQNEVMTANYLRHPAYSDYPVVGVNWIQAVEFSKWRTDRVNEAILEKMGYLKKDAKTIDVSAESSFSTETYFAAPTTTYGGNPEIVLKAAKGVRIIPSYAQDKTKEESNVYAQRSTGILVPEYRLPTEAEWEYAAAADVGQREFNNYKGQKKYPWSGSTTRSGKGDQLANFKQGNGDFGGLAGWSDDNADITNAVRSYPANDFGLYDMAGNVAEWVADVYRPIIDNQTNDFNYYRGNVFVKNKIGKDRKIELVTKENMTYDTLSNGEIIARSFPGQIKTVPVDNNETFLRRNFDQSYEINYRDGDELSTHYLKSVKEVQTNKMYNSPKQITSVDSLGNWSRKLDKSNSRTTFISDQVRVYKGGSWKDRAYWLSPSQRRFLSEDMGTDFIGFRCAMSRVGLKHIRKKSRKN